MTNGGLKVEFSAEELDFFGNIFTEKSTDRMVEDTELKLSVQTDIPQSLYQVLAGSKLTLLAEISHYQLWFPTTLAFNDKGDFFPKLGTPEIIDVNGNERSWRMNTPKDVAIVDVFHDKKIEVLSISATGLTLKMSCIESDDVGIYPLSSLEMSLAGEKAVKVELDVVRHEKGVVAAKFKELQTGRESLRKFLFNSHKVKYSDLYQDVVL